MKRKQLGDSYFFFLWFGAAVSISEIFSGQFLAPLGFARGLSVIIIGHLIGTVLLVLAGVMGTKEKASAMALTQRTFGKYGKILFSFLNMLQLIGWTAVMIVTAARDMHSAGQTLWHIGNFYLWVLVMGVLVGLWVLFGPKKGSLLNVISVILLFVLSIVLMIALWPHALGHYHHNKLGSLTMGAGIELTVIMPLSWLPLISDYNRYGKRVGATAGFSFAGYFIGSAWMFLIGLMLGIMNASGPSSFLLSVHLGMAALMIVILSTVTTTFLDAYSAAVSFRQITEKFPVKWLGILTVFIGTGLAMLVPVAAYENFLYSIGAFFSPLYAVILTDYFIRKKDVSSDRLLDIPAMFAWGLGVVGYYSLNTVSTPIGTTLPIMIGTSILYLLLKRSETLWLSNKNYRNSSVK